MARMKPLQTPLLSVKVWLITGKSPSITFFYIFVLLWANVPETEKAFAWKKF